ncbi:hypothetical protein ACWOB3_07870 [Enterococcus songbeiensis]
MNSTFDLEKIPLRVLIKARNNFRKAEWDESVGISKPKGYDSLPLISTGWKYKRNKIEESERVLTVLEIEVEKRKTLLLEQCLEKIDDFRFMSDDTNE